MHVDNMNMSREKVNGKRVDHSTISQFEGIHDVAIQKVIEGIERLISTDIQILRARM